MRRKPPVFTSSAAESTKTYRPCSSRLTARLQWVAILGRPRSTAASPCWNCLRATRPSRGRRVSPRPVGATKNCASSGSTHSPKDGTGMARQVQHYNSFKPKPLRDGLIQALGRQVIRLVGPGGAGKTTAGVALARRLDIPFVDLDRRFASRYGNISHFLQTHGYQAYAAGNVQVYLDTLASCPEEAVFALSSGFMTYGDEAHPAYPDIIQGIAGSRSTVALLPAFELELCVAETVRRQLQRPFCRPVEREEQVIRSRF